MKDLIGYETLKKFEEAKKFNKWLYEKIKPYIGQKVLEIGSGIGNITSLIQADSIIASDYDEFYVDILKKRFTNFDNIQVCKIDAQNAEDFDILKKESIDTVICCNVLEHIQNDKIVVNNVYNVLSNNGIFILLVPYSNKLYCNYDKNLGHVRRYSKMDCIKLLSNNGFNIQKMFLFNLIGGISWYIFGVLLHKEKLDDSLINLYDKLVPFLRLLEIVPPVFGASIICISRKVL